MTSPGSGHPTATNNQTIGAFLSSLGSGLALFGAEVALFYLLKLYLPRIYRPRTYLVPEKERVAPPPSGFWRWIIPIFTTKNSEFIHKCGLDAFFFLRYLRLLLKIFIPLALVILPILLPVNATGGNQFAHGTSSMPVARTTGLNVLAWGNISTANYRRYWTHLILAVLVIIYVCYLMFGELRSYIRVRQAYLTSPQHRLRASATTVLVKAIPAKWNTVEALDGLYDVFPGGIRNIWINRDFQPLSDKVDIRNALAENLENAETNLIKNCKAKHKELAENEAKAQGQKKKKKSKEELKHEVAQVDGAADDLAHGQGLSSGNPHQMQTLREFFHQAPDKSNSVSNSHEGSPTRKGARLGIGAIGEGLGGAVGLGFGAVTGGLAKIGLKHKGSGARRERAQLDGADDSEDDDPVDHLPIDSKQSPTSDAAKTAVGSTTPFKSPKVFGQRSFPRDGPSTRPDFDQLDAATETHSQFWKKAQGMPTPQPHTKEEDEFPLNAAVDTRRKSTSPSRRSSKTEPTVYPAAYDKEFADAEEDGAEWRKYLKPGDRDTMRLPVFGLSWMPFMPSWTFIGKKVDTIYYCRRELARLNLEIETDQKEPEKFPLMNSAFIQFNHQVAAHMACQSISHHLPVQMAPRMVEISPDDVIWDNMAIKWWEHYLRKFVIVLVICSMVVFWAIPSTFVGGLSNLTSLSAVPAFKWINSIPPWLRSALQGMLPAILTSLMFILVPFALQLLHRLGGANTGNDVQLKTQKSYFAFLFVNIFLVVTVASGISTIIPTIQNLSSNPTGIPGFLAKSLPSAANYFFNYMLLQALSTSAGALAQIGTLLGWYVLRPMLDSTPRQKWKRQIKLPHLKWGQFFPPYANFACIGLIYAVIAPLVLVFNIIMFGLFWVAYRYNTLYVNKFRFDTGGLLFPTAVKQIFTGLYVMEICLIGLFFLVEDTDGNQACRAQAIIMIVVGIFTVLYQMVLHYAFSPLFRYLPITLEDEAVIRDEEFARAQGQRWDSKQAYDDDDEDNDEKSRPSTNNTRTGRSAHRERSGEGLEMDKLDSQRSNGHTGNDTLTPGRWADRSRSTSRERRSQDFGREDIDLTKGSSSGAPTDSRTRQNHQQQKPKKLDRILHPPDSSAGRKATAQDLEAQAATKESDDFLFGGISDEIEDLTPEERDVLVDRAFRHRALRARRPVIWVPRDDVGISDDEIRRTNKLTDHVWISNEGTALDHKGRCVFKRSPPDFSDIDLIDL